MAYEDSRLVALYDIDNPDGPNHDFCRSLADEVAASSILDLGCGTVMLTVSQHGPDSSPTRRRDPAEGAYAPGRDSSVLRLPVRREVSES